MSMVRSKTTPIVDSPGLDVRVTFGDDFQTDYLVLAHSGPLLIPCRRTLFTIYVLQSVFIPLLALIYIGDIIPHTGDIKKKCWLRALFSIKRY